GAVAARPFGRRQQLDGAHQHRVRLAFGLAHGVEQLVHAVDQVDVGGAGRAVQRARAPRSAPRGVAGQVGLAQVRLGLDDAPGAQLAVVPHHQQLPEQRRRHLVGGAAVEARGQDRRQRGGRRWRGDRHAPRVTPSPGEDRCRGRIPAPPRPGGRPGARRCLGRAGALTREGCMSYRHSEVPEGDKITLQDGKLQVPDTPIVAFIEGDGTGPDIWRAAQHVLDAAVEKAYGGKRRIAWMEVYAGDKANEVYGEQVWLPDETVDALRDHLVGIKGPLTTPVGGGIRSINVAIRQLLDLYACVRPVQYFTGVPSPVKEPEQVDMVIFRENTEDIYAGIEFREGTEDAKRFLALFEREFPEAFAKVRFPGSSGVGLKPVSREGTERLVRAAIDYAIANDRPSVTLVHKGNIMK